MLIMRKVFTLITGLLAVHTLAAEPVVIRDYGNTVTVAIPFVITENSVGNQFIGPAPAAPSPETLTRFPVKTPAMSPTLLHTSATGLRNIDSLKRLATPLAIIGNDSLSQRWLQLNCQKLVSLKTQAMVVNVDSKASFDRLQKQCPNLAMVATNGTDLSQQLNIRHYPLILTRQGVTQ